MRTLVSTAVSVVLGASLVFGVVLVLPSATGHRSLTVLTGSMEPTLDTGSVVIDEVIRPTEARVGDIVTFSDPEHPDRLITHRLRRAWVKDGTAHMVTKGDANDAPERWDVDADGQIGRVIVHIPLLGHVRALIGSREGYLLLVLVIFALGAWVLADVWKQPARRETEPTPSSGGVA
jgi:signal peptidase